MQIVCEGAATGTGHNINYMLNPSTDGQTDREAKESENHFHFMLCETEPFPTIKSNRWAYLVLNNRHR